MDFYKYKDSGFEFGFTILSPEHNIGRLKSTIQSIKNNYPNASYVCAVRNDLPAAAIKEIKTYCPVVKGKENMFSLINAGMRAGHKEWNIWVTEGTFVHKSLQKKYSYFMQSEKDVLFPIIIVRDIMGKPTKIHMTFEEATINGVMMHQKTFLEVGDFSENPPEVSKLMWALDGQEKCGVQFKGIMGVKIC